PRRDALHNAGELVRAVGDRDLVPVAGGGGGGVAAVAVDIQGRGVVGDEAPRTGELAVADRGVVGVGRVADAEIAVVRVGVRVPLAVGGGERRVEGVDPAVQDADHDPLTAGRQVGAGLAAPDRR